MKKRSVHIWGRSIVEHSPVEDARASMYVYLRYRKSWEKDLATHGHGHGHGGSDAHKKDKKDKKKKVRPDAS